jgi:hypothetical protein
MDLSFPIIMYLFVVAAGVFFCWYVSPYRVKTPSRFQRVVAILWIVFRRLVAVSGLVFILLCTYLLWDSETTYSNKIFGTLGLFATFLYTIYFGIIGLAMYHPETVGDITLYKDIKKKYGLKW